MAGVVRQGATRPFEFMRKNNILFTGVCYMLNACFVVASLLLAITVLGELYRKKLLLKISFLDRPNLF